MIGGKWLTEINVTSPTGIVAIDKFNGTDTAGHDLGRDRGQAGELERSSAIPVTLSMTRDAPGSREGHTMSYYLNAILKGSFDEALLRTEDALKTENFGIISRIDIRQTLKAKIDVDFRPYVILGACNPALAHEALQLEDKVGLMLPCNVIVQQLDSGAIEVAAIDPVASMQAIDNPDLMKAAQMVREKLARAVSLLSPSVDAP